MRQPFVLFLLAAFSLPACEALDSIGESVGDSTGTDLSALSSQDLTAQLQSVADEYLSGQGAELPSDVSSMLTEFIQGGVDNMLQSDFATSAFADAKAALIRFLEQFLEASGFSSGEGALQTSADVFNQVKDQLCPLAPFC